LSLNDERQTVNIQGRVRPVDINDGNVVLSTRLADARITLIGDGELTERQRRSWWKRAVDWLGL
jgi:flagellar L-ring protein precursor FlgH